MSEFIKYHKYKNYICEIDFLENYNDLEPINLNKLYKISKCKINKIINIIDNTEIDKIDEIYYKGSIIEKIRKIHLYDLFIDMPEKNKLFVNNLFCTLKKRKYFFSNRY